MALRRYALVLAAFLMFSSPSIADGTVPVISDNSCLASAILYESGGEPLAGKRAVYEVITNRMKEQGATACEVVTAPKQFSWYGYKPILPFTEDMQELLDKVKSHAPVLHTERFKWFFSLSIKTPKWAESMKCRIIGGHQFCEKGME